MTEGDAALLRDLCDRLEVVHRALGAVAFRQAVKAGRVAIADSILGRIEDKHGLNRHGAGGTVIPFPKRRRLVRRPPSMR